MEIYAPEEELNTITFSNGLEFFDNSEGYDLIKKDKIFTSSKIVTYTPKQEIKEGKMLGLIMANGLLN